MSFAAAAAASAVSPPDMLKDFAGTFRSVHRQANIDSNSGFSRLADRLDVLPIGAGRALVRIETFGPNAHSCYIEGVASRVGPRALMFNSIERHAGRPQPVCNMTVSRDRADIWLSEPTEACELRCGVRAGFDLTSFPLVSRKPLKQMPPVEP